MKLINAAWEYRNVGMRCAEFVFDSGDVWNENLEQIETEFDLITAKVPTPEIALVHSLENRGYRYIENQFKLSFPLYNGALRVNKEWIALLSDVSFHELSSESEFANLLEEISVGMFDTDRFYLDPAFGSSISSTRYSNWIKDMRIAPNCHILSLEHMESSIGFVIVKKLSEKTYSGVLGGIFKEFQASGFSHAFIYCNGSVTR